MTDHVIVYSITRFDFEAVFFKEFQTLVLNMYFKKKKQREVMFEISKKEYSQQKSGDHLYYIRSPTAKTPLSKARSGILRNGDRETKATSSDEATLNRLILSKKASHGMQSQTETSLTNANEPLHLIDMYLSLYVYSLITL